MNEPENIDELYKKYPQLLPKNCISCNAGWYRIIDHMCSAIQTYVDGEIAEHNIYPKFLRIQEKFGVLNIEIDDGDEITELVSRSCEILSYHICEYCGGHGELYCSSKHRQWSTLKTLCLDHAIELYYYQLYREVKDFG